MSALKAVVKNSDLDPTALAIAIEVANAALLETSVHRDIAQVCVLRVWCVMCAVVCVRQWNDVDANCLLSSVMECDCVYMCACVCDVWCCLLRCCCCVLRAMSLAVVVGRWRRRSRCVLLFFVRDCYCACIPFDVVCVFNSSPIALIALTTCDSLTFLRICVFACAYWSSRISGWCCAAAAHRSAPAASQRIKTEFDRRYQPHWHCIVGTSFGSFVTHQSGAFVYFYLGDVAILLFKSV